MTEYSQVASEKAAQNGLFSKDRRSPVLSAISPPPKISGSRHTHLCLRIRTRWQSVHTDRNTDRDLDAGASLLSPPRPPSSSSLSSPRLSVLPCPSPSPSIPCVAFLSRDKRDGSLPERRGRMESFLSDCSRTRLVIRGHTLEDVSESDASCLLIRLCGKSVRDMDFGFCTLLRLFGTDISLEGRKPS